MTTSKQSFHHNERGAVSLITSVLMGMLMTLVVSSIASTMIAEARQSTDSEQSIRAYYAAESGVEDAMAKIRTAKANGVAALAALETGGSCAGTADYDTPNKLLSAETKPGGMTNWRPTVGWTCRAVSFSAAPTGTLANPDAADQIDLAGASTKPTSVKVEWSTAANTCDAAGYARVSATQLPAKDYPVGCPPPVEVTVIGYPIGPSFGVNDITTKNILIVPGQAGGGNGSGSLIGTGTKTGVCGTGNAYKCAYTITNLEPSREYIVRLRTRYVGSDYRLSFYSNGNPVVVPTGTATIDVTGKAGDAYRRVVYKMPLSDTVAPGLNYVIYSGTDICKNLTTLGAAAPQDGCNGLPVASCTEREPNLLAGTGTFPASLSSTEKIDPATSGFSTKLPYRGEDIFPDDDGNGGTTADQRGWSGGMAQLTLPPGGRYLNPADDGTPYLHIKPFEGDANFKPAVPAASTALFTNPNQTLDEPKGTKKQNTYTGKLWQRELTNLEPNTEYDFRVYVANIFTDKFTNNGHYINPIISLHVETGSGAKFETASQDIVPEQSKWIPIGVHINTGNSRTATFYLWDTAGQDNGDDFAMTALGVYKCKPSAPTAPLLTPAPAPAPTPTPTTPTPTADPNGNGGAKIDVGFCSSPGADPALCGGAPAGGSYHYQYSATNVFPNVPINVRSCSLDWGDGTSTGTLPGSDARCQYQGNFGDHTYSEQFVYNGRAIKPYPQECGTGNGGSPAKIVTQTLTINLWLGGTKTDKIDKNLPHCY